MPNGAPPTVEPVNLTPSHAKPVTGSLKTTSKTIGLVEVGSDCETAWLMVTEGAGPGAQVTGLSTLVEGTFMLPSPSMSFTAPAATLATTSPVVVMPVT